MFLRQQKFYTPSPLKKDTLLPRLMDPLKKGTLLPHASRHVLFSSTQAKLFIPTVEMGKQSLHVALEPVTSGSETQSWLVTALEYKPAVHDTQLLPFHRLPLRLYLKIPTVIVFPCHLC